MSDDAREGQTAGREVRRQVYEAWSGAAAANVDGKPLDDVQPTPEQLAEHADREVDVIKQLLGSGVAKVSMTCGLPMRREILVRLTEEEAKRVDFGEQN